MSYLIGRTVPTRAAKAGEPILIAFGAITDTRILKSVIQIVHDTRIDTSTRIQEIVLCTHASGFVNNEKDIGRYWCTLGCERSHEKDTRTY